MTIRKPKAKKLEAEALIEQLQLDFELGQITEDQLNRATATLNEWAYA